MLRLGGKLIFLQEDFQIVFHFGDEVPIESLTLMLGGLIVPALFSDGYFSLDKGVWRS